MKKTERIAEMVEAMGLPCGGCNGYDPRYAAYFACFNAGNYYEAHDVLEDLWLRTEGRDASFYKGLIQLAGAFVHLRKQWEAPHHPTHSRRLAPAARLLRLALSHLDHFGASHHGLDLSEVRRLGTQTLAMLEKSNCTQNPWHPERLPRLHWEMPPAEKSSSPPTLVETPC